MGMELGGIPAKLHTLFGLGFKPSEVRRDGGAWPAIRPSEPPEPNGFSLAISRSPRTVEASFVPDRFAGVLLRTIAESDPEQRAEAAGHATIAESAGVRVILELDDSPATIADLHGKWTTLRLDCQERVGLGSGKAAEAVLDVVSTCLKILLPLLPVVAEGPHSVEGIPEGAQYATTVNRYERSPANRAACIAHYGARCGACGLDFGAAYGALGDGFIEVHHKTPVAAVGGSYVVNPIADLIPLCSNCHSMVHRRTPPLPVEELRGILTLAKNRA